MPVPTFESLPLYPAFEGARVVPPDGLILINGEQWAFKDIHAIILVFGQPYPVVMGERPQIVHPGRGGSATVKVALDMAKPSLIQRTDYRPHVHGVLNLCVPWGRA